MYKNKKISVVIPCYNEEEGIAPTIKSLPSWVDEILVVDNNCYDQTAPIARKLGAKVIRESLQGYGAACLRGLEQAKGEIVVTADADGTYPLGNIGPMIDYLIKHKIDFLAGSRFPLKNKEAMPWPNRLGNLVLTWTMNFLTGKRLIDSQTGMWIMRQEIIKDFKLSSITMAFSEEIKMEALARRKIKYHEYHIDYFDRLGNSKLRRLRDGIPNFLFLFKKRWEIIRRSQ